MKDTALYEQLLGLKSPWSIKKVDLSLAATSFFGFQLFNKSVHA